MHRDHDRTLHGYARDMRNHPSEAERRMWWILRNKRLGYRFKRQVPLLGYIVDFLCVSERLIVEVDGQQHGEEDQRRYDERRTEKLNEAGYRVLRFWAWDVMKYERGVAEMVLRALKNEVGETTGTPFEATPSLTLPRSTGGGENANPTNTSR